MDNSKNVPFEERERRVVSYIYGDAEPPAKMRPLVAWYREYAKVRSECVSFPSWQDARANKIYDGMVKSA